MRIKRLMLIISMLIFIIVLLLTGCSIKESEYIAPQKYYSDIIMTTYSNSEKQNINYDMKILYNNDEFKIIVKYNNINFFIQCAEGKCVLINDKFSDNQIVGSLTVFENLYNEINLNKFTGLKSRASNSIETYDGLYKYVLEYNKNNFSPIKLHIYNNDGIIKSFEYNNVELYK